MYKEEGKKKQTNKELHSLSAQRSCNLMFSRHPKKINWCYRNKNLLKISRFPLFILTSFPRILGGVWPSDLRPLLSPRSIGRCRRFFRPPSPPGCYFLPLCRTSSLFSLSPHFVCSLCAESSILPQVYGSFCCRCQLCHSVVAVASFCDRFYVVCAPTADVQGGHTLDHLVPSVSMKYSEVPLKHELLLFNFCLLYCDCHGLLPQPSPMCT